MKSVTETFLSKWGAIKEEIATCSQCTRVWSKHIVHPLGIHEIPNPPHEIKILFVGVAPTAEEGINQGSHFYSSVKDKLRVGLFKLLERKFKVQLRSLPIDRGNQAFHQLGCFFVHCAKVRPKKYSAPPIAAIRFCAQQHLKAEILLLKPQAICFLGSNNTRDAANAIFGLRLDPVPAQVNLESWSGMAAVAHQPIRGWEVQTMKVLTQLLKVTA